VDALPRDEEGAAEKLVFGARRLDHRVVGERCERLLDRSRLCSALRVERARYGFAERDVRRTPAESSHAGIVPHDLAQDGVLEVVRADAELDNAGEAL